VRTRSRGQPNRESARCDPKKKLHLCGYEKKLCLCGYGKKIISVRVSMQKRKRSVRNDQRDANVTRVARGDLAPKHSADARPLRRVRVRLRMAGWERGKEWGQ